MSIDEKVAELTMLCKVQGVDVKLRTVGDKYNLHFVATPTSANVMNDYWGGYENYVKRVVSPFFPNTKMDVKSETKVIVYLGTLFEFLRK